MERARVASYRVMFVCGTLVPRADMASPVVGGSGAAGLGTRLATATFTNETASGWQEVSFSTPVSIIANTTYVASYHTTTGHYSSNGNYFTAGVDNPPLHALASAGSGGNGVYRYGTNSGWTSHFSLAPRPR